MNDFIQTIYSLGFLQGIIVSLVVFVKSKGLSYKLLAFFVANLALGCLFDDTVLSSNGLAGTLLWNANQFLYGPLLFLFIKYRKSRSPALSKFDWLHFLPFIVFKVLVLFDYYSVLAFEDGTFSITSYLLVAHGMGYSLLAVHGAFKLASYDSYSKFILILSILSLCIWGLAFLSKATNPDNASLFMLVYISAVFVIYFISYKIFAEPKFLILNDEDNTTSAVANDVLRIRDNKKVHLVKHLNISWIEAYDNYVKIYTAGDIMLLRSTITSLEKKLDPVQFRRIHRSYIVNVSKVSKAHFPRPGSA